MARHLLHCLSRAGLFFASVSVAALAFNFTGVVRAQGTLVYSFESDLEGFTGNGPITVTQETSGLGATHGSNSMKAVHARFNGFAGAITMNLPAAFPKLPADPGIDFLRFDLTLTSRFAPPATDPPTPGVPTFADLGITFFGTLPGNPVPEAQIQYLLDQKEVGSFEAGTYTLEIDLRNGGGDGGIGAGLNVDTGITNGYDGWIDAGFTPVEFQIYSNKSVSSTDPLFEWTFYVDNIRVGKDINVVNVLGDFNVDGNASAADYVGWRRVNGSNSPLLNDGGLGTPITSAHYELWADHFGESAPGGGSGGAVPEPHSAFLLIVAAACCFGRRCKRGVV